MRWVTANSRFWTETDEGHPHGKGMPKGSVFPGPLLNSNGHTLWLEHVWDNGEGQSTFWLAWYDPAGNPSLSTSGVINLPEIEQLCRRLPEIREAAKARAASKS